MTVVQFSLPYYFRRLKRESMRIEQNEKDPVFSSQRRETPLCLSSNMAAMDRSHLQTSNKSVITCYGVCLSCLRPLPIAQDDCLCRSPWNACFARQLQDQLSSRQ